MASYMWLLMILFLLFLINLLEGKGSFDVTFTVTNPNHCQVMKYRFSGFSDDRISDCVKACALRPYCKALNFHAGTKLCELFSAVDSEFTRNKCSHIWRKDISTKQLPCGRVCKEGTMCDPKTKSCIFKECIDLPEVENGKILGTSRSVGSKISGKCSRYYKPKDDVKQAFCTVKGTWEPSIECIPMKKCKIPEIDNGDISGDSVEVGSKITLTCNEYYLVKDEVDESFCTPSGEWEPAIECERIPDCLELPKTQNGEIVGESTEIGSNVSITCDQYYEAKDGFNQSTCTHKGWDPPIECVPKHGICDELEVPENLTLKKENGTAVGSIRKFSCPPNYVDIETSLTWTCQSTGEWEGKPSKCFLNVCTDVRCYAFYDKKSLITTATRRVKVDDPDICITTCEQMMGEDLKSVLFVRENMFMLGGDLNCKCMDVTLTPGGDLITMDEFSSYFTY